MTDFHLYTTTGDITESTDQEGPPTTIRLTVTAPEGMFVVLAQVHSGQTPEVLNYDSGASCIWDEFAGDPNLPQSVYFDGSNWIPYHFVLTALCASRPEVTP